MIDDDGRSSSDYYSYLLTPSTPLTELDGSVNGGSVTIIHTRVIIIITTNDVGKLNKKNILYINNNIIYIYVEIMVF